MQAKNYDLLPSFSENIFGSRLPYKKIKSQWSGAKWLKDTHREKAPSNETPALTKSTNICIWSVGITNQLFIGGS